MKKITLVLILVATNCFSQTEIKMFKNKYDELDYYAKPDPKNDLSKYFRRHIDYKLLDALRINDSIESKNYVYLTFQLNTENKIIKINVNSPYSELNKNISEAFKDYDIDKLNLQEKSPLNIYFLQILSRKEDKIVVNCSTDIIYNRHPVYEGCESSTSYSQMRSCINKLLEAHVINNISPAVVKDAKLLGPITLKPDFIINEKGVVELKPTQKTKDNLTKELDRVIALFPNAKTPPLRNGNPSRINFESSVRLQIDSNNEQYIADVIKSKDSTLNPNSELAIHFKKFIGDEELKKFNFPSKVKNISIRFSFDKKGKLINVKTSSKDEILNSKLVEIFKNFPIEKLNINSTNVLETYSYKIITKGYPVNVIQCNDKPDVYISACYDKYCTKSNSSDELMKCFNERISAYIVESFDTNVRSKTNLTGKVRIFCSFQVDVDTKIINVKVTASNPSLAKEMEEILKDIPNVYKPAYSNGVAIKSSYSIPIVFYLGDNIPEDPFKSLNKSINKNSRY